MGHGEHVGIGRFFAPFVETNSGEFAILHFQAAHRSAQNHFPAAALDLRLASVVKIGERHGGNSHAIAGAVRKKSLPENVDAEARIDALQLLIESADEDNTPEPRDGAFRLAAAVEPFEHGYAAIFLEISSLTLGQQD